MNFMCESEKTKQAPVVEDRPRAGIDERDQTRVRQLAGLAYSAYCLAVGGRAYNGDRLPTWEEFRDDPQKRDLVAGWCAAAEVVAEQVESDRPPVVEDENQEELGL